MRTPIDLLERRRKEAGGDEPAGGRAAERSPRAVQRRLSRFSRAARAHLVATVVLGAVATVLTVAQATLLAGVIAAAF